MSKGVFTEAPQPVASSCQGWWSCLDGSDQALVIASAIGGTCLVLAALIVARAIRKKAGQGKP